MWLHVLLEQQQATAEMLLLITLGAAFGLTSGAGVLPDSVNAAVGGSVMFTTTVPPTQTPFISIVWSFGSKTIITSTVNNITAPEYEDRITLFISTGSLELRNMAHSDAGQYSVSIIPAGSAAISGQTTLNVFDPVSDVRVTVNDTDLVELVSSVSLSCSASGPSLSYLWMNHSSELTDNDRVHLTDGGSTLTIVSVTRYDQGPFRCRVSNPVSNGVSDPVNLSINYGPDDVILKVVPSKEFFIEGSVVSLSCSADSRPEAEFQWFLNGHTSGSGAQLLLENIQMDQSGTYSCQAHNTRTLRYTDSQPALVTVLKVISGAVITSVTPTPDEGTPVNLTCDASGSIFTREWRKNGLTLEPSENMEFYEEKRVLSFINVSREDSGRFTCNISNPVSSQEAAYTMNVTYGPEHVKISGPTEVQVETTFKLSCSADSLPAASYSWIKNGTTVAHSSEFSKNMSEYSDSGEYICRAANEISLKTSEASHSVVITGAPEDSLSAGAIAGITIACLVVCAGAVIGGVYLYKYITGKKQTNPSLENRKVTKKSNLYGDEGDKHIYENTSTIYDRNL